MTHYKPYPAYKDSGVEWLGRVPEHWAVCKLSFRYSIELGKMLDEKKLTKTSLVPYLRNQDVQWGSINTQDLPEMDIHPEELERYTIRDGDLLVCEGGDVGRAAIWRGESAAFGYQKALHRLRHRSSGADTAEFFFFALLTAKCRGVFEESDSKATIAHLPAEKFRQYRFAFPPLSEQQAIVAHLNRETTRIDALVAKKTRFIELLREKRQALITHAVTKGLDPNEKMKDYGVEWLGEVPEHWEVRSTSSVSTKITNGYVGPTRDILVKDGVRYLQSLHIKGNQIRFDVPYFVTADWSSQHQKSILQTGDVLIVQTGDIGQVTVVTDEFAGCNCHALIIVSPARNIVAGEWISWVFNSSYGYHTLLSIQTGAMHPHLNCGNVKDVALPVPPLDEQLAIIQCVEHEARRVSALIAKTESSIELLKERRSALITAAVTGQIDLREAV